MKHLNILCLWLIALSFNAVLAQVTSLNEGFEAMPSGQPLINGWSIITPLPSNAGVRNTAGNSKTGSQYAFAYTFGQANVDIYFVSPLLDLSSGGNIDFWLGAVGQPDSPTTYQTGFLTDPADASTFIPSGAVVNLAMGEGEDGTPIYENVSESISSSAQNKHFAIKLTTTKNHTALYFDDFQWGPTLGINKSNASDFEVYQKTPFSKIINLKSKFKTNKVSVLSTAGQVVYQNQVNSSAQLNLSHLTNGLYLVTVVTKNGITQTKKIILN